MEFISDLSKELNTYRLLIATLGIPLLTLFVTTYVSRRNTKLSAALKVSEMRQAWINSLRDLMVDYSSICVVSYQEGKGDVGELSKIEGSINLMMNWNDKDYLELNRTMKALSRASVPIENDDGRKMDEIYKAYFKVCNAILKREWKRLKDDLRKKQV